jgi:hypothetical protein
VSSTSYPCVVTPALLAELVRTAASDVLTRRGLDLAALPADVTVERPRNSEHGDYATNVAMRTAKKAGARKGVYPWGPRSSPSRVINRWIVRSLHGVATRRSRAVLVSAPWRIMLASASTVRR